MVWIPKDESDLEYEPCTFKLSGNPSASITPSIWYLSANDDDGDIAAQSELRLSVQ